jgi:iron complex transport system ATP-binding protein
MTLDVCQMEFAYNEQPVLKDLSFELLPGEILAVLGVNGAGKSTLLKCLNRILKPKAGEVCLSGEDLRRMNANELARHFGYVPQHAVRETLTVFDAVLLGRRPYIKWSAADRDFKIVEDILRVMALSPLALRPTDELSGGELQKVLIARALAQKPDILLLDEPTSNLDLKSQIQVMNLVADAVRDQGISAVISVHDINLAFRYASRFLLLKDGRIHSMTSLDGVTPEVIRDVYGVDAVIGRIHDRMVVVPLEAQV